MNFTSKEILGKWQEYTLTNDLEMSVSVLDYGGIITRLMVPDRNGTIENVVLSYLNYQEYESNPHYFGAIIGRVAGRIQGASFILGEKTCHLAANNGENHLHGGPGGFHQVIWDVIPFQTEASVGLTLTHKSMDGDEGYPGKLNVTVTYTLTNDNQLILDYLATSDQPTPIALTNHSYFNLSGNLKKTIQEHQVTIDGSNFIELDKSLIPTGKIVDVTSTPFDFRSGLNLQVGINSSLEQNVIVGNGYDHYFIFDNTEEEKVIVEEHSSGRRMSVKTTQPGMVMYTANALDEGLHLAEAVSKKYHGVCFETQGSPASLHHEGLLSTMLNTGETYEKQTIFTFYK